MEYKEVPCKCGFTYEKNSEKFEIHKIKMGTVMGMKLPKKLVPRCSTCKKISLLERIDKEEMISANIGPFYGLPELKKIVYIINSSRTRGT